METKKEKMVEITRSFAFKLNIGNYQSADFFCSEKVEVPEKDIIEKSEMLYKFCKEEVLKSIKEYVEGVKAKKQEKKNYEDNTLRENK